MARFQSVEDVFAKCGIDGGVHRQCPLVFPCESVGILFASFSVMMISSASSKSRSAGANG